MSKGPEASLNTPQQRPAAARATHQIRVLGVAVILALGTVLGANLYMESRESYSVLEEFLQEQGRTAEAAAAVAQSRLDLQPQAPVHQILRDLRSMERPPYSRIFLRPPDGPWMDLQSAAASLTFLSQNSRETRMIDRTTAPSLGLPARMAGVGKVSLLDPSGRTWSVAVAATALRERDRSIMAKWRLSLSFVLTGGVLLFFMRWALVFQKRELEYAREMEVREMGRQKEQVLSQVNRAATVLTLASGVAHEISTPLGVISGRSSQLASRFKEDEAISRMVRTIQEEADRITRTVRRFLDLARGGTPASEDLDPSALMGSAAALVRHRFAMAGVTLDVEAPGGLPHLRGDARLLEHLLVNILLNACDASSPGSQVGLTARPLDGGLSLEVEDHGKGIPEELVERVLEPFFTTKGKGKGTGLGLAIGREIARMHQGHLKFEPAQPHGTRVLIWLPAQ